MTNLEVLNVAQRILRRSTSDNHQTSQLLKRQIYTQLNKKAQHRKQLLNSAWRLTFTWTTIHRYQIRSQAAKSIVKLLSYTWTPVFTRLSTIKIQIVTNSSMKASTSSQAKTISSSSASPSSKKPTKSSQMSTQIPLPLKIYQLMKSKTRPTHHTPSRAIQCALWTKSHPMAS